jgi:hypothetical protein
VISVQYYSTIHEFVSCTSTTYILLVRQLGVRSIVIRQYKVQVFCAVENQYCTVVVEAVLLLQLERQTSHNFTSKRDVTKWAKNNFARWSGPIPVRNIIISRLICTSSMLLFQISSFACNQNLTPKFLLS